MDTKTLLFILKTRMKANDNNPTKKHLLTEIIKALEKLEKYEQNALSSQVN